MDLLEVLNAKLNRKFALTQKLYYEFGNKAGKLLARALQSKKASHTIHRINNTRGDAVVTNEGISSQFIQYFSKLYNLPTSQPTESKVNRLKAINDFLTQFGPTPLSPEDSHTLDLPLSTDELLFALKQMKTAKARVQMAFRLVTTNPSRPFSSHT